MEHHFNTDLAKQYGILEAVLINHFQFWINKNRANNKHFFDGKYWTYNSIDAIQKLFPYVSYKSVRTAIEKLTKQGVLLVGNYNENKLDRTKWYSLADGFDDFGKSELPETATVYTYNNTDNISKETNSIELVKKATPTVEVSKSFDERVKEFRQSLVQYEEKYGIEMIERFFNYWSEKTTSGKERMRKECEKFFETGKRLATWNRKDLEINTKINNSYERNSNYQSNQTKPYSRIQELANTRFNLDELHL